MDHTDRVVGHLALPVAELVALPASFVATAVVLFVGAIALHAVRFLGVLAGFASDVLESVVGVSLPVVTAWNVLVHAAVVFATVLALLSFGPLVVDRYRRVFEEFDDLQPETAVLVPLVGTSPAVYDLLHTGSITLTWWAFAFVALWTHALAFRIIAIESLLDGDRRTSLLVGSVVAIPALVAEVLVVADRIGPSGVLTVPGHAGVLDVTQATTDALTGAGVPLPRTLLVAFPLVVALGYGLRRVYRVRESIERPSFDLAAFGLSRSRNRDAASDPWIPTSPSPPASDGEVGHGATDGGDAAAEASDSTDEPSGAREASGPDPDDESFANTQIFSGSFDVVEGGGSSEESCRNCGGAIDVADVEFCPHCGATR